MDDINLYTLETLITENLSTSTMITTSAPDEDLRQWHEAYEGIYDTENCLYDKRIMADHRNQMKILKADAMLLETKLPEECESDILWLDR